ncbi:uncharacterized protein LOC111638243 [Centruroides sculpturatus]|uniref:uncharacterized protein LOC111638243 n=1 Tax=Centruroides sculpturatus TaxID=218467 RepID=UPI000C6EFEBB|nr:uncharacterized protein LOC111638243 [Centruroides sculpturatus]
MSYQTSRKCMSDTAIEKCIAFLLSLIKQLQQRLPDTISMLKTMTSLSVDHCLNPINLKDIINLAKMFFADDAVLTHIDFQWRKIHTIHWKETSSTINLWMEVAQYQDVARENPFQDLVNFVLKILLLPHSNAQIEHLFSQMNIVKTKLWNRLNIISLSSILTTRYGLKRLGKCSYDYELPANVIRKIGTIKSYQHLQFEAKPSFEHNEEIEEVMEFNDK